MNLDPHWQVLRRHAGRLRDIPLRDLARADGRATGHALRVGPLYANFARQHVDDAALAALPAMRCAWARCTRISHASTSTTRRSRRCSVWRKRQACPRRSTRCSTVPT